MLTNSHFFLNNSSSLKHFSSSESTTRSKLHTLSTNNWLKSRYNRTTNLNYLCFPYEKQQHNMILEVFTLLAAENPEKLRISLLISAINRFNSTIPKRFLLNLLRKHDFDQDNALSFEEFKSCALSPQGKLVFAELLERLKRKPKKNPKKQAHFPHSFNTLITQVSYQSARRELLGKVKDVSLDINRRASNFFKLFTLQTKYKNPDEFDKENSVFSKRLSKKQEASTQENRGNASKCSEENEIREEIDQIVESSKKHGCEAVENLCKGVSAELELTRSKIFEEEKPAKTAENVRKKPQKSHKTESKSRKMAKIMQENLKVSRKSKATRLFQSLIGSTKENGEKRQIKFYPIEIKKRPAKIQEFEENEGMNSSKKLPIIKEYELFLPKIEEMRERTTLMKKISKFPTLDIFDEDFSLSNNSKQKKKAYFNEE